MKKFISLLKAVLTEDMDLIRVNKDLKGTRKIITVFIFAFIIMFAFLQILYPLFKQMNSINSCYIILNMMFLSVSLLTLLQGIYKSLGILFSSKDDDLLFSLPIKTSYIILVRILKLYIFEVLYNLLFLLPTYALYIYFVHPNILFYIITILMTLFLPIIPIVISSFLAVLVKFIAKKFKNYKIMQTIISLLFTLIIFFVSFSINSFLDKIVLNAQKINSLIVGIFYNFKLYNNLITRFNILDFIKLLLINIIPVLIFIVITNKYYFNIINACVFTSKKKNKKVKIEKSSKIKALVIKDLKKYLASPTLFVNSLFGIILLLVITIFISFNKSLLINYLSNFYNNDVVQVINNIPLIYLCFVIFTSCNTYITSSSISLEGSYFSMLKTLPISNSLILLSKIIMSNLIVVTSILVGDLIFFISYKVNITDTIFITLISIILPVFMSIINLFVNLKFPKINANNETEVVKQSTSSFISSVIGMFLSIILIGLVFILDSFILKFMLCIILLILSFIIWKVLVKYSGKRFKEIE